jgi:hypothetical protein
MACHSNSSDATGGRPGLCQGEYGNLFTKTKASYDRSLLRSIPGNVALPPHPKALKQYLSSFEFDPPNLQKKNNRKRGASRRARVVFFLNICCLYKHLIEHFAVFARAIQPLLTSGSTTSYHQATNDISIGGSNAAAVAWAAVRQLKR